MRRAGLFLVWFLAMVPVQGGCSRNVQAHEGKLHIAVVGDRFTEADAEAFQGYADRARNAILGTSPWSEEPEIIEFTNVFNTEPLGCKQSTSTTRLMTCPGNTVTERVNRAGAEWDKIIVIVKTTAYCGSGGGITVACTGSNFEAVLVHEFGHSEGGLYDEYKLYNSNGSVTNQAHANCWAGSTPPAVPEWSGAATPCKYPNYRRQKVRLASGTRVNSIMYELKKYDADGDGDKEFVFSPIAAQKLRDRLLMWRHSA